METALWITLAALLAALATAGLLFARRLGRESETLRREIGELRRENLESKTTLARAHSEGIREAGESVAKQVGESLRTLNESLSSNKVEIQQKLDTTQKVIATVNEQLGALGKSTERIHEIGREIRSLQDVLQAPKLRGNFGEFLLQELLQSMLPPDHFEMPYGFRDGTAVDAVVRLSGKLIPIDSKFPLEAFKRMAAATGDGEREEARREFLTSLRRRVEEIAGKYIRPEEGTYGFALMYLPSEAVYYEIVVREQDFGDARSPLQYALSRKVVPVSPSSFYAYLATIAFGLRGMQIEKEAEEIRGRVATLQKDFGRFLEVLQGIDRNLDQAKKKFDEALAKGGRLSDRMERISGVPAESLGESQAPQQLPAIIDLPKA